MKPGDILLAELDPVQGNEQAGRRPVVVISTRNYERLVRGQLVVVCPITSRDRGLVHRVPVTKSRKHQLDRPSWVITEQPRTISSRRLHAPLGQLEQADLDNVRLMIRRFLDT